MTGLGCGGSGNERPEAARGQLGPPSTGTLPTAAGRGPNVGLKEKQKVV